MIPRVDVDAGGGGWPSRATVRTLARRVRRAARAMGCTRVELDAIELRIVDDARMRVLKERHFGVAEATDVLSFPAGEPIPGQEDETGAVDGLGEIVINRDAVARQAARPGTAGWLDEATALAIHGVAHLRGHDHDRRDRARRMLRCEEQGSRAVGLPCTRPYGGRTPTRPKLWVNEPATPWSEGGAPEELEASDGGAGDDAFDDADASDIDADDGKADDDDAFDDADAGDSDADDVDDAFDDADAGDIDADDDDDAFDGADASDIDAGDEAVDEDVLDDEGSFDDADVLDDEDALDATDLDATTDIDVGDPDR